MSIDKQYHGDLEGSSLGQMLAGMSADVKDSGTYVAIERVRGTLQGRTGSFAFLPLRHDDPRRAGADHRRHSGHRHR